MKVLATRLLTVTEQSLDMEVLRTRLALDSSRSGSRRLAPTQRSVRARSTICSTVLTLEKTNLLFCCQSTRRREMSTRRRRTSKLWTTTERWLTIEMFRPRTSRQKISKSTSRYKQKKAQTTLLYLSVLMRTQGSVALLSRSMYSRIPSCWTWLSGSKATSRSAVRWRCSCLRWTITTPSGPLCMRGVRQILVEEEMDHPLIGKPVLDEMGFVASQHLNPVRDKFHLHDFCRIGEELLDIGKQPLGALSKLLLKPAVIPEIIEDLSDVLLLCAAKDETSVDTMRRMFCCNFLRKSRL
jgi:hypothetical protein